MAVGGGPHAPHTRAHLIANRKGRFYDRTQVKYSSWVKSDFFGRSKSPREPKGRGEIYAKAFDLTIKMGKLRFLDFRSIEKIQEGLEVWYRKEDV